MPLENIGLLISQRIIRLIAAAITLVFIVVIARFLSKLTKKVLSELEINKALKKQGVRLSLEEIIPSLVKYIIYFTGVILALNELGITTWLINLVFIIILAGAIIFIILAIKDFVPNVISGLLLQHKKYMKKGDYIKVGNIEGKVIELTITEARLETNNKEIVIIPNSFLVKNKATIKK